MGRKSKKVLSSKTSMGAPESALAIGAALTRYLVYLAVGLILFWMPLYIDIDLKHVFNTAKEIQFGSFLMNGNFVIGVIIFIILVTINFVVITKGSGRIAEVGARFSLDSMPGKQMAIDADLSSGIIEEKEAKRRRKELEEETSFYGSMDGAAKFVRGDAITKHPQS